MRVFIGIPASDAARDSLANAAQRMRMIADGRYVDRDMYHITLAFLGEIDSGRVADVRSAMTEAARGAGRVKLALAQAGCFGRDEGAILYAGVHGAEGLASVTESLRRALSALGLPFDSKPFKAHITLARRVRMSSALLDVQIEPISFAAEGLTLFHSCRVNGVLRYLPIFVSKFAREGAK